MYTTMVILMTYAFVILHLSFCFCAAAELHSNAIQQLEGHLAQLLGQF